MCSKNVKNLSLSDVFFQALDAPKLVFDRDFWWGSLQRSPRSLVGWGEGPLPIPFPLDAFGVSNSAPQFLGPLQTKFQATPRRYGH